MRPLLATRSGKMIAGGRTFPVRRLVLASALPAAVAVGPAPAFAQSIAAPEAGLTSGLGIEEGGAPGGWTFTLGAGAGFAPDYEGSADDTPVPLLFRRARRDEFFVALEAKTLRANLLPHPVFQIGPVLRYRPERDAVDDLADVDAAEAGVFVGFAAEGWHGRVEATQDFADAHDGWLVGLRGGYRAVVLLPDLSLTTTAFATYASDDYMEAYFGIDAADAARRGLDTFDADAGFKDVGLSLAARYGGREGFGVTAIAAYRRLLDDAADSPVVDDEGSADRLFGALLVTYGF
jgi:MipA family protein